MAGAGGHQGLVPAGPHVPAPPGETCPTGDTHTHTHQQCLHLCAKQLGLGVFEEREWRRLLASWPQEPPGVPQEWASSSLLGPGHSVPCGNTPMGHPKVPSVREQLVAGDSHWQ